ncbi:MAG TPA: hypothetical protein VEA80_05980 [Vitreimonas sp.]|uniref:hypothetical protein n=1 Tax=Vitreimonas sp. TaxID=3069702 RepID=UPI002D3BCC79|nr:hypothetical protein [Vitreimonas sp.]HYD87001.1 hypothetical protein [Vitreimonas sp.]
MTHTSHTATSEDIENRASASGLPAVVSIILALAWGTYTVHICIEIFTTPLPPL